MNLRINNCIRPLSLSLALIVSGCATMESPFDRAAAPNNQALSSVERSAQLSRLDAWTTSGSVGITYQGKTDIGTFVWRQEGLYYDFRTYGPLNAASVRIEGRPGIATLWKNVSDSRSSSSPEALMREEMGWFLPLSNLRFWSRGLAAPNIPARKQFDRYGHLALLQQQGWTINYQRYQAVGDKDLPRNVLMTHGDLRVKIVFKKW